VQAGEYRLRRSQPLQSVGGVVVVIALAGTGAECMLPVIFCVIYVHGNDPCS
jgi:hypothetical protein